MDKDTFKLSKKEETEMHLICALLALNAGFDISYNDVIFLKGAEKEWWLIWEEYYNPHSKEDIEIEKIKFDNLELAANSFIVLKRELNGKTTNGYYLLGYRLQSFKDLIKEENENTKS